MVFKIICEPDGQLRPNGKPSGLLYVRINREGSYGTLLNGWMDRREWDAFQSLLSPSPKADFVIEEEPCQTKQSKS